MRPPESTEMRTVEERFWEKQSEVEAIRALYARGGLRQRDLAARFGISQTHVGAIVRRTRRN